MKRNKILRTLIVIMILLCTVSILFACGEDDTPTDDGNKKPSGDKTPIVTQITVTFMDGDEVLKETNVAEEALEFVPEEKEGFVFDGWYLDEDLTEAITKEPTKDVTLYAKWSVATFTVRFLDGEGQPILVNGEPTQTVAYGESAIAPEPPEMEGYEFSRWNMDFSEVKSDLTIRALYDTEKMPMILYGEDGEVIETKQITVGDNISLAYNSMIELARQSLPGGLQFDGLYTDSELQNEYQIPSGEHVMPASEVHLYTKASLQDIDGLALAPSRNNFKYDLAGLDIVSSLYANKVVTYSYEWYDVNGDDATIIDGATSATLAVPCKDVGEYTYEVKVTGTYKNLTPVTASERVTIKVELGTLEGLVSASGYTATFNGNNMAPNYNGVLANDVISYRLKDEESYSNLSPAKNAGEYSIVTKIERKNYEPIVLSEVKVTIEKRELTTRIWLDIRPNGEPQTGDPFYFVDYGTDFINVQYDFEGFIGGDNKENAFDNAPAQVNDYFPGAPVGNYELSINTDNCYVSGGEHPQNYSFGKIVSPLGDEPIKLRVNKKSLTIGINDVTLTYGDAKPVSYEITIDGAFENDGHSDVNTIRNTVNDLIECSYQKGSPVVTEGYPISVNVADIENILTSYNVNKNETLISAKLTVDKANVTVTANSFTVTYGDSIPELDFTATGLVNGEKKGVLGTAQYVCDYAEGSDVVTNGYPIRINTNSLKNDNYNVSFKGGVLTVVPKAVTLTLLDKEIIYFDETPDADVFYNLLKVDGTIAGDDLDDLAKTGFSFNIENYQQKSDVGTYKVRVDFTKSDNYVVNEGKIVYGNLVVGQRPLEISVIQGQVTYGEAIDVEVNYKGLVSDEAFDPSLAVTKGEVVGGYTIGDNVGEYDIQIGNFYAKNYAITYIQGKITVVPRKLTIKARAYTEDEVVWTGSMNATDGSVVLGGEGLYVNDVISGQIMTSNSVMGAYVAQGKDLGDEFIEAQEISILNGEKDVKGNYDITYDFQVAIATYGVTVTGNTVVYDGKDHGLDVEYVVEVPIATLLFSLDGVNYSEENYVYSQAGTYPIYYSIRMYDANGELENDITKQVKVTINPRPIAFTAVGQTLTYGETVAELSYDVSGSYAEGESLATLGELEIGAFDEGGNAYSGNAGIYDIKISGLANDNYAISITNAKLTINQAPLTVTATSFNITYGDAIPTYTATCEGFIPGESLATYNGKILYSCDFDSEINRKSGDFAIVPKLGLINYKVTAINGNLHVDKMAITITAIDKNVTFGDETPNLAINESNVKASKLGYSDKVADIGTLELTTTYERGAEKGSVGSHEIVLTASSEKYSFTAINNGTITVSPFQTTIAWVGNGATYTYTGEDYSSQIKASYLDIDNASNVATVSFVSKNTNGPSTTPNKFQNASDYTVSATTADGNYKLLGATITLKVGQASYTNITHKGYTGEYNKNKTLNSGYALEANFRWVTGGAVPTVDVHSYSAIYNADSENYKDYPLQVSVELTPAKITLKTDSYTTGDIANGFETATTLAIATKYTLAPQFYWTNDNSEEELIYSGATSYTLSYSNGNEFVGGTYYTVMTFNSVNYEMISGESVITNVDWYIKHKTVVLSSNSAVYYTPEEAIQTASVNDIIIVKANTNFASKEAQEKYYNDSSYYTIDDGVTFLVPYKSDDTLGYLPGGTSGEDGAAYYDAHPNVKEGDDITPVLYITVGIPSNVTLNVEGTFTVGARTGKQDAGTQQNGITGGYSVVNLSGNIIVNDASMFIYGYVMGTGTITANNSTITENLYLSGWMGGTQSVARYVGNQSLDAWQFLEGGEVTINNEYAFPFNQYELRSIQTNLIINYGSTLQGWLKIATGYRNYSVVEIPAMVTEAVITFISSNASDASTGLIRLLDNTAKVTKSMVGDRMRLAVDGNASDGYSYLVAKVLKATVNMSSQNVFFPIDGRTDIVINSGATFTQSYKYKLMPGATITVSAGSVYNLNGQLIAYTKDFVDNTTYPYPSSTRGDAKLIINGTMNLNGAYGGNIYSTDAGKVVVANATLTVTSNETTSTGTAMDVALNLVYNAKINFTVGTSNTVTKNASLKNASGNSNIATGTTYTYNGTAWA